MSDSFEEYRKYVVICGNTHIQYNNMYKYTYDEAEILVKQMTEKLEDQLSKIDPEEDRLNYEKIIFKLENIKIEEIVYQ